MELMAAGTCGGETKRALTVLSEDEGLRADLYLAEELGLTRSAVQHLLEDKRVVRARGAKEIKANYKVRAGDEITVTIPEPERLEASPENIPLDIIYEDDDVVVVNKPRGMVVHPAVVPL